MTVVRFILGFWFLFYLLISESVTGLIIVSTLSLYYAFFTTLKAKKTKYSIQALCVILFGFLFYLSLSEFNQFRNLEEKNTTEHPKINSRWPFLLS